MIAEAERLAQLLHAHAPRLPRMAPTMNQTSFGVYLQHSFSKSVMADVEGRAELAESLKREIRTCALRRETESPSDVGR